MDPIIIIVVAGVSISAVLVLGSVIGGLVYEFRFSPRARLRQRLAVVVGIGDAGGDEKGAKGGNPRRRAVQAKLRELEEAQKRSKRRREIRQLIQETGLEISMTQFYLASIGIAVAAGVVTMVLMGFDARELIKNGIISAIVALATGYFVPKFGLGYLAGKRQKAFVKGFADAVDVIVRGIQTGLPTGECLKIIGSESPEPIAGEFRLITEGQRIGLTLDDALQRSVDRMPIPELKFFAIVLSIQQQTGGNLAETLGNLSRVLRERKKMDDKILAMSSEARSTAMIIGSMPFLIALILFLVSRDYIMLLFVTSTGHILLGVIAFLMGMGAIIMKGMMSFEV